jgi:hypothetical protein
MASAFECSIGSDQRRWMQSPRRPAIASSSGISSGDVLILVPLANLAGNMGDAVVRCGTFAN